MDNQKPLQKDQKDVPKVESNESPGEAPLFDKYTVKIDVPVSSGAVPTGRPPVGY